MQVDCERCGCTSFIDLDIESGCPVCVKDNVKRIDMPPFLESIRKIQNRIRWQMKEVGRRRER